MLFFCRPCRFLLRGRLSCLLPVDIANPLSSFWRFGATNGCGSGFGSGMGHPDRSKRGIVSGTARHSYAHQADRSSSTFSPHAESGTGLQKEF